MGNFKFWENQVVQIIIAILIPNLGGILLYLLLRDKIEENDNNKDRLEPGYGPSGLVVGIAWMTIFTLIGIASWRVWRKGGGFKNAKKPLLVYFVQLLINWIWTLLAFDLDNLLAAIIDMIILLIFVVINGIMFYKIDKISGCAFIPYFIYLAYATVLCIHIYILNY